jgi:hypothetical protein
MATSWRQPNDGRPMRIAWWTVLTPGPGCPVRRGARTGFAIIRFPLRSGQTRRAPRTIDMDGVGEGR